MLGCDEAWRYARRKGLEHILCCLLRILRPRPAATQGGGIVVQVKIVAPMSRLEKERDVLARHLQLSTQALEEFKELHEAETSALSEAHEELQAENADLRAALQQRDQDFQALSVAFDRMLTWREAQLDQQDVQGGGPQTSTMPQVAAEYSDSEDIDIEYEQPREYSHKRLLHARSLAVELSRELERHRDQLSQLQEEKAAALFLLQAKKDQLEELQAEQATREAEPDTLNGLHTQVR